VFYYNQQQETKLAMDSILLIRLFMLHGMK
jgi:hypothetical protein